MKIWNQIDKLANVIHSSVVTVGNFDGIHLGHQRLLKKLRFQSRARNLSSIAITFHPHPAVVLGYPPPPILMTVKQRAERIADFGVNHLLILPFNRRVANYSAEDFVSKLLIAKLGMKIFCIGPTTHVGRNREGNPKKLKALSKKWKFRLVVVPPVLRDRQPVSSSGVRNKILRGEVQTVSTWLGRPYRTAGKIVRGAGRGEKMLGIPTANLGTVPTILPKNGVYLTRTIYKGKALKGVTNVGFRPTLEKKMKWVVVETHLLDFKGNLVGERIQLEWMRRLRDEKKFPTIQALKSQIMKDIKKVT